MAQVVVAENIVSPLISQVTTTERGPSAVRKTSPSQDDARLEALHGPEALRRRPPFPCRPDSLAPTRIEPCCEDKVKSLSFRDRPPFRLTLDPAPLQQSPWWTTPGRGGASPSLKTVGGGGPLNPPRSHPLSEKRCSREAVGAVRGRGGANQEGTR